MLNLAMINKIMGTKPIKEVKPGPKNKGRPPSKIAVSRILGCIKTGGTVSSKQLLNKCGYASTTIKEVVKILIAKGCVERKRDSNHGNGGNITFIKGQ